MAIIAKSAQLKACEAALSAGADGFVSKGDPLEQLLAAMEDCRERD